MNIQENEQKRQIKLYEYMTTTHLFCVFVMLLVLILNKNFFVCNIYPINVRFIVLFLITLIGFGAIIAYNSRVDKITEKKFLSWIDLLYIGFPLVVAILTLYIIKGSLYYPQAILLIPIIITASILGKMSGVVMATISSFILVIYNLSYSMENSIFRILEANLIFISVMYILGWFISGLTDLENDHRKQLTKMANTDVLTGLYNHRYFQEKLKAFLDAASEENPLSLIMLDIDYFKNYNDSYGHLAGDNVLKSIGIILKEIIKKPDFSARYGGEEFVVVLPKCNGEKAVQIAEEIRAKVKGTKFIGEEHQPEGSITVSCGIATCPNHANNIKDLIKYADQALYKAKNLNKNKVELYHSIFDNLEVEENERELVNSIHTLVSVINARDRYTYGHSERVTEYSLKLANKMGLREEEIRLLSYAAFLHDIGKIEIDRDILNKPGRFNEEEWNIVKQHPTWGSDIVKSVKKLSPVAPLILYHHENYDGTGYPTGIKGESIPLLSRIIKVVDSYDAMISNRTYKKSMFINEALEELQRCSGTMFDPVITEHFIKLIKIESEI